MKLKLTSIFAALDVLDISTLMTINVGGKCYLSLNGIEYHTLPLSNTLNQGPTLIPNGTFESVFSFHSNRSIVSLKI